MTAADRLALAALRIFQAGGWAQVNVTTLAEEAQVARRTYYRCFDDLDDALHRGMEMEGRAFAQNLPTEVSDNLQGLLEAVFAYWQPRKSTLVSLGDGSAPVDALSWWFKGASLQQHKLPMELFDANRQVRYVFSFMTGGICSTLIAWAQDDGPLAPNQMAALLARMFSFASRQDA